MYTNRRGWYDSVKSAFGSVWGAITGLKTEKITVTEKLPDWAMYVIFGILAILAIGTFKGKS